MSKIIIIIRPILAWQLPELVKIYYNLITVRCTGPALSRHSNGKYKRYTPPLPPPTKQNNNNNKKQDF